MHKFTIHKPTHKFFGAPGELALAIGQRRGDTLYLNRFDNAGNVIERTRAVGSCCDHLTGYGKGVAMTDASAIQTMRGAWRYVFGYDVPTPVFCELVERDA